MTVHMVHPSTTEGQTSDMMTRIDSHAHIDVWSDEDERFARVREHSVGIVSWAWISEPPGDDDEVGDYLERQGKICARRREEGLSVWRMVGVHPRSIPISYRDSVPPPDHVAMLIEPFLAEQNVVGVGEVGLEMGTPLEVRVFESQLALALACHRPCGIHTPRQNKKAIFEQILSILKRHRLSNARILIDHIDHLDMLDVVLRLGCHAGITVSPSKASPESAIEMVRARAGDQERIMFNSDAGRGETLDDYNLFLAIEECLEENAAPLGDSARRFFGESIE